MCHLRRTKSLRIFSADLLGSTNVATAGNLGGNITWRRMLPSLDASLYHRNR